MCNVCMKYDIKPFSGVVSVVFRGTEGSSVVSVIMRPSKDVTFRTKEDCYIAKYIVHYTTFDFFTDVYFQLRLSGLLSTCPDLVVSHSPFKLTYYCKQVTNSRIQIEA